MLTPRNEMAKVEEEEDELVGGQATEDMQYEQDSEQKNQQIPVEEAKQM